MKYAWLVVVCACGKGGGDKPGSAPAAAPSSAPAKKGVTGSVTLSGALSGTFTWKDDLAINACGWVETDQVKTGNLDVTMTDGKDTFISVGGKLVDGKLTTNLTSGKIHLPHAGQLTGNTGITMTGTYSGDNSTVAVTFQHAVVTGDDQSVTIDGHLDARCNY